MSESSQPPRRPHDPVYRRIFSNAGIIEQALRRFLKGPWLGELDFSTLESSVVGKLALSGETIPRLRTLQKVRNMFADRVARWPKQWLEQGRQEGLRTGKAEILADLASRRFGDLPQWVMDRFDRADVDTLHRWSSRLLDAERLEDVFDDK